MESRSICTWFTLTAESPWRQQYEEQAHQNRQLEKELKQLQEEVAKQKGDKGSQPLAMWHTTRPSPYIISPIILCIITPLQWERLQKGCKLMMGCQR